MVHGSMNASSDGTSFVPPEYFCFHNERGTNPLRWSGTQNVGERTSGSWLG